MYETLKLIRNCSTLIKRYLFKELECMYVRIEKLLNSKFINKMSKGQWTYMTFSKLRDSKGWEERF